MIVRDSPYLAANYPAMRSLPYLCLLLLFSLSSCTGDPETEDGASGAEQTEAPPPPLEFVTYTYDDSTALREHGPYFVYHLETLRATGGPEALREAINDSLDIRLFGFTVSDAVPLDTAVRAYLAPEFADYRAQEVQEEWLQEAPHTFAREQDELTEVVYRGDSLIVLAHRYYEYTGGAHGMHFTDLLPFSVDPPQLLDYDDVFLGGKEDTLSQLLLAKAMETPDRIFGDSVPVTRNLAPLPEGVRFLYEPYAIGPYASGEIALDLPYASLRGILRPGVLERLGLAEPLLRK